MLGRGAKENGISVTVIDGLPIKLTPTWYDKLQGQYGDFVIQFDTSVNPDNGGIARIVPGGAVQALSDCPVLQGRILHSREEIIIGETKTYTPSEPGLWQKIFNFTIAFATMATQPRRY